MILVTFETGGYFLKVSKEIERLFNYNKGKFMTFKTYRKYIVPNIGAQLNLDMSAHFRTS